ncbi:MAG: phytanoyl-CoA dioxygenase family protein [Candidatus Obscuribacterales bacterium]|nr:phytanoyl-CoA dioxygenase family protein [Candidatus Obscuribacterales bacterium]
MTTITLSKEQLRAFEQDGFVVLPKLYSQSEINAVSQAIDALAGKTPEAGKEMVYFENDLKNDGERILSRIENFVEYNPVLHDLVFGEKMMSITGQLLEDEPCLFKEKINFKMPGGAGFEPHQDIQPGWDDYCPYFISVLVTIDESTVENGCLELAAGFHKNGLLGEKWKPLTPEQLEGVDFVPYPMSPGDVALFDCFVPHQSKPNLTNKQRRNLYLTFNRKHEGDHRVKYYADKRASYPPDNEREAGKEYKFKV